MHRTDRTSAGGTVRVRAAQLRRQFAHAGLKTDAEIAERIGVNRTTVLRMLGENGNWTPGPRVIAGVLLAFPGAVFGDFFEVIEVGEKARAA
jgi:hypothetical protein